MGEEESHPSLDLVVKQSWSRRLCGRSVCSIGAAPDKAGMGGFFLHTPRVCEHQGRSHSQSSVGKEQPGPAAELHLLTVILGKAFALAAPLVCSQVAD